MARRRLGVALVLDPPEAGEVDGLRRAVGDRALARVAPHVTLVPPINVRDADLTTVLSLLRDGAATAGGPLHLALGPPATFLPDNPVLYLPVTGDEAALSRLRDAVFAGPLWRPLTWPWVPHVTLADDVDPVQIGAAVSVLGHFEVTATCDRLVLLEERHLALPSIEGPGGVVGGGEVRRRWVPLADATFGPRHIVGRGGLQLELAVGRLVDPEAAALLRSLPENRPRADGEDVQPGGGSEQGGAAGPGPRFPIVCAARREGAVVGVGAVWSQGWRGYLGVAVDPGCRRQGIGTHVLARLESVLAEGGWVGSGLEPLGPVAFYRGRSATARL